MQSFFLKTLTHVKYNCIDRNFSNYIYQTLRVAFLVIVILLSSMPNCVAVLLLAGPLQLDNYNYSPGDI